MWRLYPTHCQIPIASQNDLSILAATDLLTALGRTIPILATAKAKYVNAIRQLTSILTNQPAMRMDEPAQRVDSPAPRVAESPPPRVATTSNNITSPTTIQQLPLIHQQQMRSNNPFQILADNDDNDDMTVVASNCSPRSPLPNLNPINLPVTPPKTPTSKLTKMPAHNPTCNSIDHPNQYAYPSTHWATNLHP
jgi:hypothetical protein